MLTLKSHWLKEKHIKDFHTSDPKTFPKIRLVLCSALLSWERANLLALLYVVFSCVFVTFPCGVLDHVLIPDLSLLTYLVNCQKSINSALIYVFLYFENVLKA